MALRPIKFSVTVRDENGNARPAIANEVKIEIHWGSSPWQHGHIMTGYKGYNGQTGAWGGGGSGNFTQVRHTEGGHIAIWERKRGEKGYGSNWYHIRALVNGVVQDEVKLLVDDINNTYDIEQM